MKLALVTPLPPMASPAADFAARILAALSADGPIALLPHSPELVDGRYAEGFEVAPQSDLRAMLKDGDADLPVYLIADNDHHAAQLRLAREVPGLIVLLDRGVHATLARITEESGDLEGYRELLVDAHGEAAREWPERFVWRPDRDRVQRRMPLTGAICRTSRGVLAAPEQAERLRARYPNTPIFDLPDTEDPAALAATIRARAAEVREHAPELHVTETEWPSVEVLIVGYNCKRIIRPALESIAAQDYPNLRCTLVDNASADGTGDFVRTEFPWVNVVTSEANLGFAGGNNLVMEHSDAKYVVLFNQDAIARRDFVRELVRVAERDANIAAVGGKMLMLRCPTVFNSTGIIVNEGGFAVDRQIGEKDEDPTPVPERVFGACGGAKLVRSSTIRAIGGFDETFFMYCEDVDLCWRMRLRGYDVLYAPLAVVHHDWFGDLDEEPAEETESEVNAKTLRRRSLCERNRMQCVLKNLEGGHLFKVLRRLRKYDKVRNGYIREAIQRGQDIGYFQMVGRAIRSAWTWNLKRAFSMWRRRSAVQASRTVSDAEIAEFVDAGVAEYSHVGDLHVIHDRHCAVSAPRLQMGVNDQKALGPGWYGVEPVPDQEWDLRWNKGLAWFYIDCATPARVLKLRIARGPITPELHVILGAQDLGRHTITAEGMHVLELELPEQQPEQRLIEVRLESTTFRPCDHHDVPDERVLGLQVAEAWLE